MAILQGKMKESLSHYKTRMFIGLIGASVIIFGINFYNQCRSEVLLSPLFNVYYFSSFVSCNFHLASSIPTITHQFGMTLVSTSVSSSFNIVKWSIFWLVVNIFFEIGQLIDKPLAFMTQKFNDYFVFGTFDLIDIYSMVFVCFLTLLCGQVFRLYSKKGII